MSKSKPEFLLKNVDLTTGIYSARKKVRERLGLDTEVDVSDPPYKEAYQDIVYQIVRNAYILSKGGEPISSEEQELPDFVKEWYDGLPKRKRKKIKEQAKAEVDKLSETCFLISNYIHYEKILIQKHICRIVKGIYQRKGMEKREQEKEIEIGG